MARNLFSMIHLIIKHMSWHNVLYLMEDLTKNWYYDSKVEYLLFSCIKSGKKLDTYRMWEEFKLHSICKTCFSEDPYTKQWLGIYSQWSTQWLNNSTYVLAQRFIFDGSFPYNQTFIFWFKGWISVVWSY